MATIGNLIVNVLANTGRFGTGMASARKHLTHYQKSVLAAQKTTQNFQRALGAIGVGFSASRFIGSLKATTDEISLLVDTSQKLGIATEELSALRWAGKQTGVDAGTLDAGIQKLTKSLAEAAKGTGKARKEIKELGVDAAALSRQSPDQQFRAIAAAMSGVENQSDKVRIAFKLFGGEGTALLNTLDLGASGLRAMERDAKALGIAISDDAAKQIEELGDKLERVGAAWQGAKNQILIDITPAAMEAVDSLADAMVGSRIKAQAGGLSLSQGFVDKQFPMTQRILGWAKGYVARHTDKIVRADIAAGIASGSAATGSVLQQQGHYTGPHWGMESEQKQRDQERTNRDVSGWLRKQIGQKAGQLGGRFSGTGASLKAAADKIQAAMDAMERWAMLENGKQFLFGNAIGEPGYIKEQRERLLSQMDEATDEARLPVARSPLAQGINAALEKGTQEAYRASMANILAPPIAKQQLTESKKQTTQLMQLVAFSRQAPKIQMVAIPR